MEKAFDYTSIPSEVKQALEEELKKSGDFKLVMMSKYSQNKRDDHLWVVMGKGGHTNAYTTWIYNTSIGGLNTRHSDMTFKHALMDFAARVKD